MFASLLLFDISVRHAQLLHLDKESQLRYLNKLRKLRTAAFGYF